MASSQGEVRLCYKICTTGRSSYIHLCLDESSRPSRAVGCLLTGCFTCFQSAQKVIWTKRAKEQLLETHGQATERHHSLSALSPPRGASSVYLLTQRAWSQRSPGSENPFKVNINQRKYPQEPRLGCWPHRTEGAGPHTWNAVSRLRGFWDMALVHYCTIVLRPDRISEA